MCPFRVRTPPSRARSGTMCPGREKSLGREMGEASARAVRPRSCAEIPVDVPEKLQNVVKDKAGCGGARSPGLSTDRACSRL